MNEMFRPLLDPRGFVKGEREAGNPSFLKAVIALTMSTLFAVFAATFAVFPIFQETRFMGTLIPSDANGALWNFFLLLGLGIIAQLVGFATARYLARGKGKFAEHAYFCSTLSIPMVPVAALLSTAGIAAGFILRTMSNSATAGEFASNSWPFYYCSSMLTAIFPAIGYGVKIPVWAFDGLSIFGSPVPLTVLIGPLLSIVLLARAQAIGLSEVHGISGKKSLLVVTASSLALLIIEYFIFKVYYVLAVA